MHLKVFCNELMYGYWVLQSVIQNQGFLQLVWLSQVFGVFFLACSEMEM